MNKYIILFSFFVCSFAVSNSFENDVWETQLEFFDDLSDTEFLQELQSHQAPETIEMICIDGDPDFTPEKVLTDLSLAEVGKRCPSLKSLSFIGNKITDEGVCLLAEGCPNLEELYVGTSACIKGNITDKGVMMLAKSCPQLVAVDFESHHGITDEGVIALAENCPYLESLIVGCYLERKSGNITDRALFVLAKQSQHLQMVDVTNCKGVTFQGAKALLENCSDLEELSIDCTSVTKKEYKQLQKIRPDVEIFWI